MLEVRLLGQFDIRRDGQVVHLPLRPAQSLFAYLLLFPGIPHRRDKLAGLLWPDLPESSARGNLRHTLWRLRKALGPSAPTGRDYVLADEYSLTLDPQADLWVDTRVLELLPLGPPSLAALTHSVEVYRGELLPGCDEDWVTFERERLQAVFETRMAHLLDALVQTQRWDDVLAWGERWIALGHIPEAAYRALILAHAARGDMAGAAAAYQRCLKALREHLGVDPSPATRAAYDSALRPSLPPSRAWPPPPAPRHNLPAPLASFIGRERELDELHQLVIGQGCRLVTVTGPAGCGKTRLAVEAARRLLPRFAGGVCLVELAPVGRAEAVPAALCAALGLQPAPGFPLSEILAAALRDRELLLLLDNCEHVLDEVAPLVLHLLAQCAALRALITSRETLGTPGEQAYPLAGLSLPEPGGGVEQLLASESGRLLAARATAARPAFAIDHDNAGDLIFLCRSLDGLPLALELAAARLASLSPSEVAAQLGRRFRLLAGSRVPVARHRSLEAAISWSFQLLSPAEQQVFSGLSVFRGGWTLEAAQAVCAGGAAASGDVLSLLNRLVQKSLVVAEPASGGGRRYRLLETMREFGYKELTEASQADAAIDRHVDYFLRLAQTAQAGMDTLDEPAWAKRLAVDEDNLFVAMQYALEREAFAVVLEIGSALRGYLMDTARRWSEYVAVMARALERDPDHSSPARIRVLCLVSYFYSLSNQLSQALAAAEQAIALAQASGDSAGLGHALWVKGAPLTGEAERACYVAAVQLARQTRDIEAAAAFRVLAPLEPPAVAQALLLEYHQLALSLGSLGGLARAAAGLGELAFSLGNLAEAERQWQASLHLYQQVNNVWMPLDRLQDLARTAWMIGNYARAASLLDQSFECMRSAGWLPGLTKGYRSRGCLAWWQGDFVNAEACYRESAANGQRWSSLFLQAITGVWWTKLIRDRGDLDQAEAQGEQALNVLTERAAPIGYTCWCRSVVASIAHRQGDPARAVSLYREALHAMPPDRNLLDLRDVLEGHALALAAAGELPLAARLLGFTAARLADFGVVRPVPEQRFYDQELARLHASLPAPLLAQAWDAGSALSFEQAVTTALGNTAPPAP